VDFGDYRGLVPRQVWAVDSIWDVVAKSWLEASGRELPDGVTFAVNNEAILGHQ
jgi:hypothetical protein